MEVTVRCFGEVEDQAGTDTVTLSLPAEATVEDALEALQREWGATVPEDGVVMLNGRHVQHLDGLDTALSADDALSVSGKPMRE